MQHGTQQMVLWSVNIPIRLNVAMLGVPCLISEIYCVCSTFAFSKSAKYITMSCFYPRFPGSTICKTSSATTVPQRRFCVQSVLLCEQIYWCKAVEQALMTEDTWQPRHRSRTKIGPQNRVTKGPRVYHPISH